MSDPFITMENVTYKYSGDVTAVRNVNLQVNDGEVVAILGSNGSGKTTLVKHLNGLLKPTSGIVKINGYDSRKESIAKLSSMVGYVFQNPNHQTFLPTVRQELTYGCKNLKMPDDQARKGIKRAIELFGLKKHLDENPFDLNASQRKEIAMAAIMAISPKVIVLDEPTTGQDHAGCKRILNLVRSFQQEGHIVILITHDMQLVGELNCRVVVMSNGRKIADGTAERVFSDKSIMEEANLEPPQVTHLSEHLPYLDKNETYLTVDSLLNWYQIQQKERKRIATGS